MERVRNISKSMLSYLKRAQEQKEFLLKETREFEKAKRHLANMMGIEPAEMTQAHVDDAIKYLFPSGLFASRAQPKMKHPDLVYRAQKDAQFDIEGRPKHYLFYTTMPNYFENLAGLSSKMRELNKYEDEQLAAGVLDPPSDQKFTIEGRAWISQLAMEDRFLEKINEADYEYFKKTIIKLSEHPYSARAEEIFKSFSEELPGQSLNLSLPNIERDETTGSIFTKMIVEKRKHVIEIKTILNGSGQIDIDGRNILYFEDAYLRRGILAPIQLSGMVDKIDIIARVVEQPQCFGPSAVAGSIRYAVANSIAAYLDTDTRERLRLAGFLTKDVRRRERKKFGQEGARRKYTWKKR